jgi:hypothetical protein
VRRARALHSPPNGRAATPARGGDGGGAGPITTRGLARPTRRAATAATAALGRHEAGLLGRAGRSRPRGETFLLPSDPHQTRSGGVLAAFHFPPRPEPPRCHLGAQGRGRRARRPPFRGPGWPRTRTAALRKGHDRSGMPGRALASAGRSWWGGTRRRTHSPAAGEGEKIRVSVSGPPARLTLPWRLRIGERGCRRAPRSSTSWTPAPWSSVSASRSGRVGGREPGRAGADPRRVELVAVEVGAGEVAGHDCGPALGRPGGRRPGA